MYISFIYIHTYYSIFFIYIYYLTPIGKKLKKNISGIITHISISDSNNILNIIINNKLLTKMNNIKNKIELNKELYAKLQQINEDYYSTENLKTDCEKMCDMYNKFINVHIPYSYHNHNSFSELFKLNGNKFKMEKDLKPAECIPNFEEINHEIKKIIVPSTPLSIKLKKTDYKDNEYYFELFQHPSCGPPSITFF